MPREVQRLYLSASQDLCRRSSYAELKEPEGPNIQLVTLVKLTTLIRIYDAELRINTLLIINNSVSIEIRDKKLNPKFDYQLDEAMKQL